MDAVESAPELRGVHCPDCGGSLVRHRSRAYCDWCMTYPKPELDADPLPEEGTPEYEAMIEELERQRRFGH